MLSQHLFVGALFIMSTATGASAPSDMESTTADGQGLQFLVTLPVKPDHLDRFLATMHQEVAGARSEPGNIAFDVFQNGNEPATLYLFEHWVNEEALDAHTAQPYYKAIRAQEADDLAGSVEERELSEVTPAPRTATAGAGRFPLLSVLETTPDTAQELIALFSEFAGQLRALNGNRTFALYRDKDKPTAFLLIERWTDPAARDAGLDTPVGHRFMSNLAGLTSLPLQPVPLLDRSH